MAVDHFKSHNSLDELWAKTLSLVSGQKRSTKVKCFIRSTKKKEKEIYEESMVMDGASVHFPKSSLLAGNEINGVWTSILLDGQRKPKILPYGTQCCELPADEIIGYLRNKPDYLKVTFDSVENAIKDQVIKDQVKWKTDADEIMVQKYKEIKGKSEHSLCEGKQQSIPKYEVPKNSCRGKKNNKRETIKPKPFRTSKGKVWKREDFLKDKQKSSQNEMPIEKYFCCSIESSNNMRDPFLFFENAYYFNKGTQYIRMILISAWDRHLQWCKENLYEVPLSHNCILQWKNGILTTTIRNVRPKIVVDVLVVGDVDLRKIENVSWFTTKKGYRASREPRIDVLEPKEYFVKHRS